MAKKLTINDLLIVMLSTLFNVCLSLILLLSIVVITVLYVCKLRSPARRQLPHTNSPRHRHSNAQPPVAVHHEGNPITSILPTSTLIPAQHPFSTSLNFGTRQGSFATLSARMASQNDHDPSTTLPCLTRCQSFGRLMSRGTFARLK